MKVLIFLTSEFPYRNGETFIESEIECLSKFFDSVFIYATNADINDNIRSVPCNVYPFAGKNFDIKKSQYARSIFKPAVVKEIIENLKNRVIRKVGSICYFDQIVASSSGKIEEFLKQVELHEEDQIIVCSYWLYTIGAVALNISGHLEEKGYAVKKVARTHGFDLYSERNELNYLPFQRQMIGAFDSVFPCSINGTDYLKNKYPQYAAKIQTKYLGVVDRFEGKYPILNSNQFTIVSCSNVIPVKRVELIVQALRKIKDIPICWLHFGDGELIADIQKAAAALPNNIHTEFLGRVKNTAIYDYYKNNNVNLFVNVSSSEGLPVSIMEAISFGIPVIATDVGGTGEIVEDGLNGYLITENFETNLLSEKIRSIYRMPETTYSVLCHNARMEYEEKFSAEKNYTAFAKMLLGEEQNGES